MIPPDTPQVSTWLGPRKCGIPECTSRAIFKSRSAWKSHMLNIHINPLLCREPHCTHKKPFSKSCDLKRHLAIRHDHGQDLKCPDTGCSETFLRNDKLQKHVRERHQQFQCSQRHCTALLLSSQIQEHCNVQHGPYECGIGSCSQNGSSHFTEHELMAHLTNTHKLRYAYASTIMRSMSTAMVAETLEYADYSDCDVCRPL